MLSELRDAKYQKGDAPAAEEQAGDVIVSPDTRRASRIPPGQSRTRKWPVLDAFGTPQVDVAKWRLQIFGLVERPLVFSLAEFQALPRVKVFADFHCVTHWSRLGNLWEGVATRELLDRAGVKPEAKFVVCHGCDNGWTTSGDKGRTTSGDNGWTTNLPLADFLAEDALLADTHDGQPIAADHGGPVRGMVPQLYAWKSAKWICGIELVEHDQPGYWERGGYHLRGDPWLEQRFRED